MAVRREVAGLPVGAGDHTEPQARRHRVGGRRGQRTPDRRPRVAEPETVPVGRFWSEAAHVDLDGMVALGILLWTRATPTAESVCGSGLGRRVGGRGDPGPEQDPVWQRVTGGDPVLER